MHVFVEPALLERTVFHATRADTKLATDYQRAFARCYSEAPGERRDMAFADLHERWFDKLGLRDRILERLSEFPNITGKISRFVAVDARARARSGAELFGKEAHFALVLAITPSLLLDTATFDAWARFELQHIEDMLDPDFGYDVACRPGGTNSAKANLAHDRFVILWAMSIDARLHRDGAPTDHARRTRYQEFVRAFRVPDADATRAVFLDRWDRLRTEPPKHASLVEWAENGIPGLRQDPNSCGDACLPTPGAKCSLCGFSTFDWAGPVLGPDALVNVIQSDFPAWTPHQPICRRCEEVYRDRNKPAGLAAASQHPIGA